MPFWAKYNTGTTFEFPLIKRGAVDFAQTGDYTPAATDSAVSKDNGNFADTTNTVAIVGGSPTRGVSVWKLTLTATELSCAVAVVQIVDAATKAVEDQSFQVYTYGNASAYFAGDWSDIVRLGLTALPNVASGSAGAIPTTGTGSNQISVSSGQVILQTGTGTGQLDFTSGVVKANLAQILGTALTETAGQIAAAFKKFFDKASPTGTINSIPDAVAGASGGILISGSNAGTTTLAALTVTGSMTVSDGLLISRSTSNASAITATGNGTGSGAVFTSGGGATGDGIQATAASSNGNGFALVGIGSGHALKLTPGATGNGMLAIGGATSGSAVKITGTAGNAIALEIAGQGSAAGLSVTGGATGAGAKFVGGGTSGASMTMTTTSGDGLSITPTAGSAIVATANGTSKHGAIITGGTAGTSDGMKLVAGTGGVDFRATTTPLTLAKTTNITGFNDIAAGDVWDVTLASHITAGSTGFALNAAGSAGDPWGTALPGAYGAGTAGNIIGNNLDATVSSRMATYTQPTGFLAATFPSGTIANTTNITAGTITTVTNLTNAPTAGDFTATMKTSIGTAVAASAVASVAGNVGGNVTGSVGSVTGAVGSVTAGVTITTNNDKTGYTLSTTGMNNVSDNLLDRDMSTGTDSGSPTVRTPRQALRALRNKNSAAAGIVYKEDDTTTSWSYTLTTDAAADPITVIDPA